MGNLVLAVAVAVLYRWSVRHEPRQLRLGVYLVAALWFLFAAVLNLVAALLPQGGLWPLVVLTPLPVSVLVLAGYLIAHGLTVVRHAGRGLGALLWMLPGPALVTVPMVGLLLAETAQTAQTHVGVLFGLAALAFLLPCYLGLAFLCFLAFTVTYRHTTARADPAAVVVLGSNLVHGRIPRQLEGRLDRGIDVWQQQVALGHHPLLVPSGGSRPDEARSEGAAMADYLVEHGIPAADVVAETAARTTEENLALSQQVVCASGRAGHLTVVTSGYHVARTSLLSRRAGLDADVLGSPADGAVVRRALLREFVTVLTFYPRLHLVLVGPAAALAMLLARTI